MKVFKCIDVKPDLITLDSVEGVRELYIIITKSSEDFILEWDKKVGFSSKTKKVSKLIINSNIKDPIKKGEIRISSES